MTRTAGASRRPRSFFQRNSLGIVCGAIFVVLLLFQALTGWTTANNEALAHGGSAEGFAAYLWSGHFAEATFENWESEFLQMAAFIVLTVFLIQKGSVESKDPDENDPRDEDPRKHRNDPDAPWPVRQGGLWLVLYQNSLLIAFAVLFLGAFVGHLIGGAHEFSREEMLHGGIQTGPRLAPRNRRLTALTRPPVRDAASGRRRRRVRRSRC